MAIIFQKNIRNNYIRQVYQLSLALSGGSVSDAGGTAFSLGLTIWGGVQPSAAAFETNWASTYKTTYLVTFGTALSVIQANAQTPDLGVVLTNNGTPTATAALNSGTATWAVVWDTIRAPSGQTTVNTLKYMIVPISDTSGNAPLRMTTTTITAPSTYSIADFAITAVGGVA